MFPLKNKKKYLWIILPIICSSDANLRSCCICFSSWSKSTTAGSKLISLTCISPVSADLSPFTEVFWPGDDCKLGLDFLVVWNVSIGVFSKELECVGDNICSEFWISWAFTSRSFNISEMRQYAYTQQINNVTVGFSFLWSYKSLHKWFCY